MSNIYSVLFTAVSVLSGQIYRATFSLEEWILFNFINIIYLITARLFLVVLDLGTWYSEKNYANLSERHNVIEILYFENFRELGIIFEYHNT